MKGKIWAWVRTLGGVGIIVLLIGRLGSAAFVDSLRVINVGALVAAFGIGVVATIASAWRWCLAARGLGLRLPLRAATADYYQALFLNATLPGGLLGDVDRAVRNGREAGDVSRSVRAVVLERTAGQIVLLAAGVGVLLAYPSVVHVGAFPLIAAVAGCVLTAVVVVALHRVSSRVRRMLGAIGSDVRFGLLGRRNGPGIALASVLALAAHLATFVLAARVAGATASLGRLLPLMVLALVVMGLPISVGGWGPREGFCAWAFGAAGLTSAQGLTVAVVYGVFAFVASLPGLMVLVARLLQRRRPAASMRPGLGTPGLGTP